MKELKEGAKVKNFCYEGSLAEGKGIVRLQLGQESLVPWIQQGDTLHNCAKLAWVELEEVSGE